MKPAAAIVALAVLVALSPAMAGADPPGPTDYRTEIVGVTPAVPGLQVRIVGGDAFVELVAPAGRVVVVTGYRGEEYLRFGAGGTVEENRASPTFFANRSRYGAPVPAEATREATPDWVTVGDDGSFAWHDHRTHWMNRFRPPGRRPGDVILEAVVPLRVDGRPVEVAVRSVWVAAPSLLPPWLGGVVGLAVGAWALASFRTRWPAALATSAGVLATSVGSWTYLSVPAETGPSRLLLALPAIATVAGAGGLTLHGRRWWSPGLVAVAAGELVLWAWRQRDALTHAILPTHAPAWLARAVVAGVGAAGLLLAVAAAGALVARCREPGASVERPVARA